MVRVGVKIPQDENCTNVAVVHGHVWRTVCSVCATGGRVAQPVPCRNLSFLRFLEVSPAVVSTRCFTDWCEDSTKTEIVQTYMYKHVAVVHEHFGTNVCVHK
jgi:hypothetical protein